MNNPASNVVMDPKNFVVGLSSDIGAPADFSNTDGIAKYVKGQTDKLFDALRYAFDGHSNGGWPLDDPELNTLEALRHVLRLTSIAHSVYMEADYAYPVMAKLESTHRQWQLPSPDAVYLACPLHGDYSYRLSGYRGTATMFQTTLYRGHACDVRDWLAISKADSLDTPQYAPGSTIDVVLSRICPADLGDAVWLELPEGRCELQVRQYYGDWDTEKPGTFAIERIGASYPPPNLNRHQAEERFNRVVDMLKVHTNYFQMSIKTILQAGLDEVPELAIPGAFEGVIYFNGKFCCAPDEAVIVEIEKPSAPYWNVSLYNLQYEAYDWWARFCSFNLKQARPDSDGKVRFVISWQDPGVPNWLDTSGRVLGLICFRFFKSPTKQVSPKLKTVKLADIRNHLPVDTSVVTPEERHAAMQRRVASVTRRLFTDA